MTEFPFERGELLSNLVLLEDHADKFQCPYCMEKHTSKIIGYAEEIALGGEDTKTMKELAEAAREWRRFVQGAKEHSHKHGSRALNPRKFLPFGLTACEKEYVGVQKKLSRCIKETEKKPGAYTDFNPVAVCRASIKCPP